MYCKPCGAQHRHRTFTQNLAAVSSINVSIHLRVNRLDLHAMVVCQSLMLEYARLHVQAQCIAFCRPISHNTPHSSLHAGWAKYYCCIL